MVDGLRKGDHIPHGDGVALPEKRQVPGVRQGQRGVVNVQLLNLLREDEIASLACLALALCEGVEAVIVGHCYAIKQGAGR